MDNAKNFNTSSILVLLLFAVVFSISCGDNSLNYTVETVDGIRYVHNIRPKYSTSNITLEFVRQFGELEAHDENSSFFKQSDVSVDDEGNVYVLDTGNYMVKKFNRDGEFIESCGRKGQGPGEFEVPESILMYNEDFYVAETGKRELIVYSKYLEYIGMIKRDKKILPIHIYNEDKLLVQIMDQQIRPEDKPGPLFYTIDGKGNIVSEHGMQRDYGEAVMTRIGNSANFDVDDDGNIYSIYIGQNRLEKYDKDLNLISVSDRILTFEESTEFELNREGTTPMVVYNSFSYGLEIDANGRLWSLVTEVQDKPDNMDLSKEEMMKSRKKFEIFDDGGVLLMHYDFEGLKRGVRFRIFGERLFIVDANYEMVVKEYRIIEK